MGARDQAGRIRGHERGILARLPPARMVDRVGQIWDIKPDIPTLEGWIELLESAGLRDILVQTYKFDVRREATQVQRYDFQDRWRMLYRMLFLYIKNPAFREYMAERRYPPKDLFEHLGYALFVGRR